ncbi:JmjC domain-containing protein [Amycolatopsis rubida]|uniref:Cupin superfamily protein n=1 Tax=Amycolatopsis rubida TaxID=112413 RepID=A0A1I5XCZ5_9PSEU|nr:cupin domain-containing protein [Amycolatopsis rubida]SFQ29517.1 Cupin superfamily protein [Amycolatopsis rubida]
MDHALVRSIEKALGWTGASGLGVEFARGSMADPELCSRLLTPQRLLDVVMRRSLSPPQFRCFEHGTELHPDAYITRQVTRRGQSLPVADMDRIGRFLRSGCTLVLDALDAFDPTMEVACRALQWWSREVTQVNTYLTTADAAGFSLHWDDHDVVIVQLAGEKYWEVRGTSRPVPMYLDVEPNTEPSEDIVWSGTMKAGDVMHIPRGYWHQATRADRGEEGYSLHVTFGFVKRTGVDWLTWVADRSRERELFRHDLDRWGGADALVGQQERLADEVQRLLDDYPVARYLVAREQERTPPRQVATAGVFGPPTAVLCVAGFPPHVVHLGDTVEVLAGGKKLTFAGKAEPALAMLLSGHPVDLATVSKETGVNAAVLAEALIKEGVCAELTEALSSGCTGLVPTGT